MPAVDLLSLAERVSDGQPIDWDDAERSTPGPEARRILRNLRLVQSLTEFHRQGAPGEGATSTLTFVQPEDPKRPAQPATPRSGKAVFVPFAWGGFELRAKLGEGGFGEVYRAWDPKLQRELALKLLKSEASARVDFAAAVLHEARLLARVRHPNIVSVHGADEHDGRVGLWMELVRGRSLASWIEQHGRMGAREAAGVGIEVCRALAAVHGAGLVHRDVKAGNVMREEGGRILLMDFGAGSDASSVPEGSISGTPRYIAPEVYAGEKASSRSDIYSAGVLLYHLVTGSYPVEAESIPELRRKIDKREARLLRDERPDLPEAFVKAVERSLAWDPAERFATAGEMERALSAFLGSAGSTGAENLQAGGAVAGQSTGRSRRRTTLFAAGAALTIVVLAVLGIIWKKSPEQTSSIPSPGGAPPAMPGLPPPPAAAPSYSVEASLWRVGRDDSRRRLDSGARLAVGDRLALEFRSSASVHVYVIDEDEQGHAFALFPLPDLQPQNPLPSGTTHLLPGVDGAGKTIYWNVTSTGGREHLLILASPERLVEFEAAMSRLKQASSGARSFAIPEEVKVRLRGIGGLVQSEAPASGEKPKGTNLFEMAETLAGRSERVQGPWLRRIDLDNPPR